MEWTKEQLYMPIQEASAEDMAKLKEQVNQCQWRQSFHIQPPTGLLNDPNGLAYFNGEYHFFYQWFPLGPVHGLKYWKHLKSKDMVRWEDLGIGIAPDRYYDNCGAYSGSAIEHEDKLYLMYTGNRRDENWVRQPMQALAVMNRDSSITKLPEPVIKEVPTGYTDHFRDPKVWKQNGKFYAAVGAQRVNKTGCIVLYESHDLFNWKLKGEIETAYDDFGYMWECPDYIELDGQGILIFSPQGIEGANIYQSGYVLGQPLDLDALRFAGGEFQELDAGFDFYAPQTFEDGQGRRILVGWMGLPEINYPTDSNQWAHCLTLPRELKLVDGHLHQVPIEELKTLRKDFFEFTGFAKNSENIETGVHCELEVEFSQVRAKAIGLKLRVGAGEETVIRYNGKSIELDRSLSGAPVAKDYGTVRSIPYTGSHLKLRIFMDTSSIEIFINDGQYVMSSRIFPSSESRGIEGFAHEGNCQINLKKWELK